MRILLAALMLSVLTGWANDLSDEPYGKVAVGMNAPAVAALLGMESTVQVHSPQLIEVTWWQDAPTGRVMVTVLFLDGQAFSKLRTFNPFERAAAPPEKH